MDVGSRETDKEKRAQEFPCGSLQRFGSLLCHRFNPWLGNFHMLQGMAKKEKEKREHSAFLENSDRHRK